MTKPYAPRPDAHKFINSQIDIANAAEAQVNKFNADKGFNVNLFDIPDIDAVINPAKPEDYVSVCANPGNWKTGYLANLLRRDSEKLNPMGEFFNGYFSWEMTVRELAIIEVSNRMAIPVNEFVRGNVKDIDAVKRATDKMRKIPTYFFGLNEKTNDVRKRFTIDMVEDAIGILGKELQLKPRLVCPDYIQASSEENVPTDQRRSQIESISMRYKLIGKNFNCAVVAASQANFEVVKRDWKVPKQEDHYECKAIAQHVDKHIGIWYVAKTEPIGSMLECKDGASVEVTEDLIIIEIDKQRFGKAFGTWYLSVDLPRNNIRGMMSTVRSE